MWETPFDAAMLERGRVVVHCPREDLIEELFRIFDENGVRWYGTGTKPSAENSFWLANKEETCYRVDGSHGLGYGSLDLYSSEAEFSVYTKCTFYGADTGFEVASDTELMTLLGMRGAS